MKKSIALLGNPNSGKTSLFNKLTGGSQQVGNWPGVTVERKSGLYRKDKEVMIQDLPGIYSLSPYSLEEEVSKRYLLETPPDLVINIIDATNLERSLYLTLQLLELDIPLIIGLNMMDRMTKESGREIDVDRLSYSLGLPVIPISALKNQGLDRLMATALSHEDRVSFQYDERLEVALAEISELLGEKNRHARYDALQAFEALPEGLSDRQAQEIQSIVKMTEKIFDDDASSIVVNERYDLIGQMTRLCLKNTGKADQLTDKIDRLITNKWLGLPIFVLIMWMVYYLSIQTVGKPLSDWLTDDFFAGWLTGQVQELMATTHIVGWLQNLVNDGILAGLGAVLGFVPQIFVLFLLLGILEDSGYMARVAFVMDRLFRRFGLSGKSFIPMLISSGCGVPGIMATRTIEQEQERKITIMITTFMPCSAKLPLIALISGAFFRQASWVAPSAYFLGVGMIIVSGIMLKKTRMFAGDTSAFIMELPSYHLPGPGTVLKYAWDKAFSFIKRAGTLIFIVNVLIWFLANFNFSLQMVDTEQSVLAQVGSWLALLFAPLGFGEWRAVVATLTGFLAKETVVGTMGVLYAGGSGENRQVLWQSLSIAYVPLAAYSFLVFNLLCAPCVAAVSTIAKEMGDIKWTLRAIAFQTGLAYAMSFIIYQLGEALAVGHLGWLSLAALLILAFGLYLIFRSPKRRELAYESL
ncbi:ferrous iron transport protein B [Lactococcus termiticola]|uniref:Ferrous iron transport protein B n=1 Tax=Lactococcus termiticola TaxID=2169526 RepID=A0A2R5HDA0_9LACT|nr:ferrous iron transport protein B [Lactococcus termiticola]GBG96002.1 ferrous iron transporter B [Lactococcus termiticola]